MTANAVLDSGVEDFSGDTGELRPSNPLDPRTPIPLPTSFSGNRDLDSVLEERLDSWVAASVAVAESEYAVVESHPDSIVAWGRYLQAALDAGLGGRVVDAAIRILQLAKDLDVYSSAAILDQAVSSLIASGRPDQAASALVELPDTQLTRLLRARVDVERGQRGPALLLLGEDDSAESATLRAYILLELGKPQSALHYLRHAYGRSTPTPDLLANMGVAYKRLGSRRKAINSLMQAAKLAPGRDDIVSELLRLQIEAGDIDRARSEFKRLRLAGVVESPRLAAVGAQLSLQDGKPEDALRHLRRAARLAETDEQLGAEFLGNSELLEVRLGRTSAAVARRRILALHDRAPASVPLLLMLSDLCDSSELAPLLRSRIETAFGEGVDERDVLQAVTNLAALEGDYERASGLARDWTLREPLDPRAAGIHVMLLGQISGDWAQAAKEAVTALARCRPTSFLVNNCSYVMALGGRPKEALALLRAADDTDSFFMVATRGLALIAIGDMGGGLSEYRRAAELADKQDRTGKARVLMTIHQAMGLRWLGLMRDSVPVEVEAGALPPLALPEGWRSSPSFRLLEWVAQRRGWEWPVFV